MKKLLIVLLFVNSTLYSQYESWKTYQSDRGPLNRICEVSSIDGKGIAKLRGSCDSISFSISTFDICEENPSIEFEFVIDGEGSIYEFQSSRTKNQTELIIIPNIMDGEIDYWRKDFFNSARFFVRINYRFSEPVTLEFFSYERIEAFRFLIK